MSARGPFGEAGGRGPRRRGDPRRAGGRRTASFATLALGLAFLAVAGLAALDLASLGFPDGHLSAFERETRPLRLAALVANLALAAIALAAGAGRVRSSAASLLGLAAAFALVAVPSATLPLCPGLPSCVRLYEAVTGHPPDHGVGG